jgi:MFS family permease
MSLGESRNPAQERVLRFSWDLLSNRQFRRYFVSSLVSNLGTWLQNTAQVLLAYQFTHSVFAVGAVASAQFAGALLLSPWAPVLADRIGNRATLVGAQLISSAIAGGMSWAYSVGKLGISSLVIGALGLGTAFSLALPVQTALVPKLVEPADTETAVMMNGVSYNSGRAIGPALCILVIAFDGLSLIFALNAVSFAIFALVLARLKPTNGKHLPGQPEETREPLAHTRVTDVIRILRDNRRMLLLLAMVAAVTFADDPILVLSPALTHAILHISSDWTGYFISALGWGTVTMGFLPSRRKSDSHRLSRRAAYSLLILGVSIAIFTAGWSTQISLAAAFTAGAAALLTNAPAQTLILAYGEEPGVSEASVGALWVMAWAGTKPLASLLDGWLASNIGIWKTGIMLALPAIILAVCEIGLPRKIKNYIKSRAEKALP